MLVHDLVYRVARPQWDLAEADARIAELAARNGRLEVENARLKSELETERERKAGFWIVTGPAELIPEGERL